MKKYLNQQDTFGRERARLQTVPEDYVDSLTELESADMLGDGWTIDVIANIFRNMK